MHISLGLHVALATETRTPTEYTISRQKGRCQIVACDQRDDRIRVRLSGKIMTDISLSDVTPVRAPVL